MLETNYSCYLQGKGKKGKDNDIQIKRDAVRQKDISVAVVSQVGFKSGFTFHLPV